MSSLAEAARVEWVSTWAFAHRNIIMARRNVFFLFELTFWPGVAMLSHGLLTRFLDLTPQMTAFILVGTVSLSAVQVCQLDVAYAVLFDIWSKSMKHQFLAPVRIYHLALGSWLVGVVRGIIVFALMAWIGAWAFGFDFIGGGTGEPRPVPARLLLDRPRRRAPRVRPRAALRHARGDLGVGRRELRRDAVGDLLPGLGAARLGGRGLGGDPAHVLSRRLPGRVRLPVRVRPSVPQRASRWRWATWSSPTGRSRRRSPGRGARACSSSSPSDTLGDDAPQRVA